MDEIMASGRMLKREISNSVKLGKVKGDRARVLYFMMFPHLDILGRLEANTRRIRGQITTMLPYTEKMIQAALEQLRDAGLIILYSDSQNQYLEYTRFGDFQTLNPSREAESTIPAPTPEDSGGLQRTPLKLSLSKGKDKIKLKEYMVVFESARELYPGIKVGMETEYANFVYHCKHPLRQFPKIDHLKVLPLLKPAIEKQIEWRKTAGGEFRPEWKIFATWINNRCWEEEPAVSQKALRTNPVVKCAACGKEGKRMSMVGHKPYCSRECRQKGEGW